MADTPPLYELYGQIGNKTVQAIRMICRDRITGQNVYATSEYLSNTADELRHLAECIRAAGGSEEAALDCEERADVFEHYSERPQEVQSVVWSEYRSEHGAPDEYSTADYQGKEECPYEDNPSKRQCWSCHVPNKVYNVLEREYNA